MNSKAVVVRGLEKSYQGHQAVDGIDLEIESGEILGPNGAGKTTMVEILAGQKSRTKGSVEVLGEDPAHAGRGMTNAEIGRALFISEATVKTHLLRACTKLGVSGRTAAVAAATERGLLKPPGS